MDAPERALTRVRSRVHHFSPLNRYGLVLVLIAATYVTALAASELHLGTEILIVLQLTTVWLVFSVSDSPRIRRVAGTALLVAGVLSVAGSTIGTVTGSAPLLQALYLVNILLYAVAPLVILRHVLMRSSVDRETLLATLCAYLLIGMMFAFTYRYLGSVQSTPFFGASGVGSLGDDLFFSFITLTTTGYGNLVPAAELGQTLAVTEAVIGQFFLAGVVAKIVTAWRPRATVPAPTEAGSDPES